MKRIFLIMLPVAALSCASCGPRQPGAPGAVLPEGTPYDCVLMDTGGETPDTLLVALSGTVGPDAAPVPRNGAEEVVFAHLYETLIEVDCRGRARGVLADSWSGYDGGRRWVIRLRDRVSFTDGSRLRPADVVESWKSSTGRAGGFPAGIDTAYVSGRSRLTVVFDSAHRELPEPLASPRLAVVRRTPSSRWVLGTAGRVEGKLARVVPGGSGGIVLAPPEGRKGPVLVFLLCGPGGARDALDSDMDMMVTGDPAAIEYASRHGGYEDIALPWDKVYVLLSTSRVNAARWERELQEPGGDFLSRMASEAVRADARAALGPYWWERPGLQDLTGDQSGWGPSILRGADPASGVRNLVWEEGDETAREIAERLVALASSGGRRPEGASELGSILPGLERGARPSARALPAGAFRRSLESGESFAYVTSLPVHPADRRGEAATLLSMVPWLGGLGDRFPLSIVPLVETRPHLIARKGRAGVVVGRYGGLRIGGGGR